MELIKLYMSSNYKYVNSALINMHFWRANEEW